jgi:TonB family protein
MGGEAQVRLIGRFGTLLLTLVLAAMRGNGAQAPVSPGAQTPGAGPTAAARTQLTPARDFALEDAEALIGRAIFLRGGYAGNDLTYDTMGHIRGEPKQLDWTLSAANIEKVFRHGPGELELDGTRVVMRYNPDQHVFERHPQKDDKLKIVLAVDEAAHGFQGVLATIFAVGIDPGLQRAMPLYWRHYFSPGLAWPNDDLTGKTIIPANAQQGGGVQYPVLDKKSEPEFTLEARADKVRGLVQLRLTVGPDGLPRRISIKQPLGYGLDQKAVEAAMKYRFRPGMKDGQPVAIEMLINQNFD